MHKILDVPKQPRIWNRKRLQLICICAHSTKGTPLDQLTFHTNTICLIMLTALKESEYLPTVNCTWDHSYVEWEMEKGDYLAI